MSKYTDKAMTFRESKDPHYNCAQATLMSFVEHLDLDENTLMSISTNFAGGMKVGGPCGAITGGLMVLSLFGISDMKSVSEYYSKIKEKYDGMINCADLLKDSVSKGIPRRDHCNRLIFDSVSIVEEMLQERNLI